MEIIAKLRHLRTSPKKIRLIVNLVRGLKVEPAIIQLGFLHKAARKPVIKLINSAVANATNNFNLKKDNLYIKEIRVDMAGVLKRWMPKAHGRATPILKKLSHIIVVLAEVVPSTVAKKKLPKVAKEKATRVSSKEDIKEIIKAEKVEDLKIEQKEQKLKELDLEEGKEIIDVRSEGKHRHNQNEDKKRMKGKKGFIKKMFNRKAG